MLVDNSLLSCYLGTHLSHKVCQDSTGCHLLSEGKIPLPFLSFFPSSFQTNSPSATFTHTHYHVFFFHCLSHHLYTIHQLSSPLPPLSPLISSLSVVVRQGSCMPNSWSKRGSRRNGAEKRREGERKRDSESWRDWRERRRRRKPLR